MERDELILSHLSRVRAIAVALHRKVPVSVDFDDLYQSGVVGLIRAADRFNAQHRVKFWTLAQWHVRGAMLDSLRALDYLPRDVRIKLKVLESKISKNEECFRAYCRAQSALLPPVSLSALRGRTALDVTDGNMSPHAALEERERIRSVDRALSGLQPRMRFVVTCRLRGHTMMSIGKAMGVNESRVSQINTRVIQELRRLIQ